METIIDNSQRIPLRIPKEFLENSQNSLNKNSQQILPNFPKIPKKFQRFQKYPIPLEAENPFRLVFFVKFIKGDFEKFWKHKFGLDDGKEI